MRQIRKFALFGLWLCASCGEVRVQHDGLIIDADHWDQTWFEMELVDGERITLLVPTADERDDFTFNLEPEPGLYVEFARNVRGKYVIERFIDSPGQPLLLWIQDGEGMCDTVSKTLFGEFFPALLCTLGAYDDADFVGADEGRHEIFEVSVAELIPAGKPDANNWRWWKVSVPESLLDLVFSGDTLDSGVIFELSHWTSRKTAWFLDFDADFVARVHD